MIGAYGALSVGVLLLFLILVWLRASLAQRDDLSNQEGLLDHESEGL